MYTVKTKRGAEISAVLSEFPILIVSSFLENGKDML